MSDMPQEPATGLRNAVNELFSQEVDNIVTSEGETTSASGWVETPTNGAVLGHPNNTTLPKPDDSGYYDALRSLKKRDKKSKFRRIKSLEKVRIGDKVRSRNGFPMYVTGIFQDHRYEDMPHGRTLIDIGTLYLDFDGNEGDVWEEDLCDVSWDGDWINVLWKKLTR